MLWTAFAPTGPRSHSDHFEKDADFRAERRYSLRSGTESSGRYRFPGSPGSCEGWGRENPGLRTLPGIAFRQNADLPPSSPGMTPGA